MYVLLHREQLCLEGWMLYTRLSLRILMRSTKSKVSDSTHTCSGLLATCKTCSCRHRELLPYDCSASSPTQLQRLSPCPSDHFEISFASVRSYDFPWRAQNLAPNWAIWMTKFGKVFSHYESFQWPSVFLLLNFAHCSKWQHIISLFLRKSLAFTRDWLWPISCPTA